MRGQNKGLLEHLDKALPNGGVSEKRPLNSIILLETLRYCLPKDVLTERAAELREIESEARNTAAHEIVSVTEEWLQKRVGYTSQQIMKLLKNFTQQGCSGIKSDIWDSYDDMNKKIIELLKN